MGELSWVIRTAGTVNASPERVQAWWVHPDRREDFRDRIERTGVTKFSQEESTVDGVRIRTTRWKDRKGWTHETRVEATVDLEGKPIPDEDGSFPLSQKATIRAPLGYRISFTCSGRLEFKQLDAETTEVVMFHNHKAVGGTRFNRQNMRKSNQEGEPRDFQGLIDRCHEALQSPPKPESNLPA